MKDLNLIPKSYILARHKKAKRVRTVMVAVLCSMAAAVCIAVPLFLKLNLQKQVNEINMKIEASNGYRITQERLNDIKERYNEREKTAGDLEKYEFSAVSLLKGIESGVPEKLFISSLNVGSENEGKVQITLAGTCATEDDVASFVNHLRKDNYYSDIIISSLKKISLVQSSPSPKSATGVDSGDKAADITCFNFNINLYLEIKR